MALSNHEQVRDRMQTALAITHHIQTRISQGLMRGRVSEGVAIEVSRLVRDIEYAFAKSAADSREHEK